MHARTRAGVRSGSFQQLGHDDCLSVHRLLEEQLAAPAAAAEWKQLCGKRFQWSPAFDGKLRLSLETLGETQSEQKASEGPNGLANGVGSLTLND